MAKWDKFDVDDLDDDGLDDVTGGADTDVEPAVSTFNVKPARIPLALLTVACLFGASFAATSTSDFVNHLDRQVHAIHCGVMPGGKAQLGESGCRTVMLSPFSSWFRDQYWGGIPISLFALAVFAFLTYRSVALLVRGRPMKHEGFFLTAATLLPVVMSGVYYNIAVNEVGALCETCAGIYGASGAAFLFAIVAWVMSESAPKAVTTGHKAGHFALGFVEGCVFVGVLGLVYVGAMPDASAEPGAAGCGNLVQSEDPDGVMIPLKDNPGGAESIEVLDPLCPACRAFDARLTASGLDANLDMKAVLFPLDNECNWMVSDALHPGACAVSEAMLCANGAAGGRSDPALARRILDWAFENQQALHEEARADPKKLRARIESKFPSVQGCLGSHKVRNKLVRSLRWAVSNALPVLTPQLFVGGRRICDQDTDLGLEYTLTSMLEDAK
jgi:hypothetical protein